jgi:putative transposase
MNNFIFKSGLRIIIDGKTFKIASLFSDGRAQLESEEEGILSNTTLDKLLHQYSERRLHLPNEGRQTDHSAPSLGRPLSTFSEELQQDATRKKRYLDFIHGFGSFISTPATLKPLIVECASQIGDSQPPSAITVYRWHRQFVRSQKDCRALIPQHDRKGGSGARLRPAVVKIINSAIDEIYLTTQRNSGMEVYAKVEHCINQYNKHQLEMDRIEIPSKATVYRVLRSLDKFSTMAARFGPHIAKMRFRTSGKGVTPTRVLERVEIDHTPLDLFVIDAETGLPQGRPTVTVAIDTYSKMPVGMHIGFSGTSIEAVFRCLRRALTPKTYIKKLYPEIEHDWPSFGHIENLVCDNGLEFHSKELERLAFELGMQIQFCPKRQAYYKGSIERFLKTLNFQFARMLPGHSFAKWFQREDYDPQKEAVVTFDQLMRYLHRWLLDIYAQEIHRGINKAPYHAWLDGVQKYPPRLLGDLNRLDIALGRTCERTIFHYGFELHNLRYNSHDLLALRRQHGESVKVEVRYQFDDISVVHVIDPITKEPIPVPALDHEYAHNLSVEQHRLICARTRAENEGKIDSAGIAKAKAEIREIIKDLSLSKLQRKRQRAAKLNRVQQDNSSQPVSTPATHAPESPCSSPSSNHSFASDAPIPTIDSMTFSRPMSKRGK